MADPRSPKLIEDYVRVTYWSCDVVGHRHATERAAHRCIGLRPGERGSASRLSRNLRFLDRIMAGDPIVDVAREGGCVPSNVAKAVLSMLLDAQRCSGSPYPWGHWSIRRLRANGREDPGLAHLVRYLREEEAKLRGIAP